MPHHKYRPFLPFGEDGPGMRRWPAQRITAAPMWCSVDLRDGNQALVEPMGPAQKLELFTALVDVGFTEIEVGFPSASQPDYDFVRDLIEQDLIPDSVTIQVLVQCRPDLIARTYEALRGAQRAIVHFYNSTSVLQRDVVFGLDTDGITRIAVDAAKLLRDHDSGLGDTHVRYEYSPESFTGTEPGFAVEICAEVMDALELDDGENLIVNVPATVEMYTPNVYADVVEYMHRNLPDRANTILSVHPHNDRGTAVAAAELALLAGADRVEGTLFGNGERTGNVDLVTLALNMFTQGIDCRLDLSDIDAVRGVAERATGIRVHERHPYAGDLVHTAFSGSHQDAIKKGFDALGDTDTYDLWQVPYLPIDPAHIGRSYEEVIRVNSQSGKAGPAYVLRNEHGFDLPRGIQIEFAAAVQRAAEASGTEVDADTLWDLFRAEYIDARDGDRLSLLRAETSTRGALTTVNATVADRGVETEISGTGNGPISALMAALAGIVDEELDVVDYREHAVTAGSEAFAAAYIELRGDDLSSWGVGVDTSILLASLRAVISALNRRSTPE